MTFIWDTQTGKGVAVNCRHHVVAVDRLLFPEKKRSSREEFQRLSIIDVETGKEVSQIKEEDSLGLDRSGHVVRDRKYLVTDEVGNVSIRVMHLFDIAAGQEIATS